MTDGPVFALVFAAALGSDLIAGFMFAFSTGVMSALRRVPAAHGIETMQAINIAVINPVFLGAFVGTAVLSLGAAIMAVVRWGEDGSLATLVGGTAYVIGAFVVTMAANVPMNNALALADPTSEVGGEVWIRYLARWTAWNHVRTVASLAACAAFILALATS